MLTTITNLLARLRAVGDKLTFIGPTLARLTVGLIFIGTGWGKLHSLGDVTEFFGGILVLVGLGTRLAALPLAFTMVIAILTAKRADIDGLTTLVGFDEWTYLVLFLWLAVAGAGPLSLDNVVTRWWRRRSSGARADLPKPLLRPQTRDA